MPPASKSKPACSYSDCMCPAPKPSWSLPSVSRSTVAASRHHHRREAVSELAERRADGRDLALDARCRRRHDKTETAQYRSRPPLEADAALGLQHDVARRVLIEPLHVQLNGSI